MADKRNFGELVEEFLSEKGLYCVEGRRGVTALCTVARAIGYKDPQDYGQLTRDAALGDLIMMLEDNSGMIEAMLEWLQKQKSPEWKESIAAHVQAQDEEDEDIDPVDGSFVP